MRMDQGRRGRRGAGNRKGMGRENKQGYWGGGDGEW